MVILDASKSHSWQGGPSFSRNHRILRVAWRITWLLLASWTPPGPGDSWRRMLLRIFGAQIGRGARIYGGAHIWYPPNLRVDRGAAIANGAFIYSMAPIHIGVEAIISQRAHLCAGSHDVDDPHFQLIAMPIMIGARAWVAAEAFVGPGVSVGEGAVLAARGVAVKDLEPFTVYAGNPARPVRARQINNG